MSRKSYVIWPPAACPPVHGQPPLVYGQAAMADLPRTRLYVADGLAEGVPVAAAPQQAHHLRAVLRLAAGDRVRLFNGRDGEWLAVIAGLGKGRVSLEPVERIRPQAAVPDLWLCFAPIKRTGIDFIAEKATELGAAVLQPVLTRHTDVTRVNVERLRLNAIEAAAQCERVDVPEVRQPVTLDALLAGWPAERALVIAAESGAAAPITAVAARLEGTPAALLVGPEGGFAKSELDRLADLPFAHPVGLGPRVLRADTAAIAALACWQCLAGDWSQRPAHRT